MKAKELAERLLKHPNCDVKFDIKFYDHIYEYPWLNYRSCEVTGISYSTTHIDPVLVLEVEEIDGV